MNNQETLKDDKKKIRGLPIIKCPSRPSYKIGCVTDLWRYKTRHDNEGDMDLFVKYLYQLEQGLQSDYVKDYQWLLKSS